MKKKSDFINSELIRLSCEWAHYVSECFTLSRWRSFTFSVASDGPHFFPSMSPRSMVHPLTSWEWHRTLTYNCICAQRLHSRNVLALCYIGINHLWSIGWLGFFLVLLEKKKFLFSLVNQVLKRLKKALAVCFAGYSQKVSSMFQLKTVRKRKANRTNPRQLRLKQLIPKEHDLSQKSAMEESSPKCSLFKCGIWWFKAHVTTWAIFDIG